LIERFTFHDVIVTVAAQTQAPLVQVGNITGSNVTVNPPGLPLASGGLQVPLIGGEDPPALVRPRQANPPVPS
jgi:hypothetical protein